MQAPPGYTPDSLAQRCFSIDGQLNDRQHSQGTSSHLLKAVRTVSKLYQNPICLGSVGFALSEKQIPHMVEI
jgi:hypothetical protein